MLTPVVADNGKIGAVGVAATIVGVGGKLLGRHLGKAPAFSVVHE